MRALNAKTFLEQIKKTEMMIRNKEIEKEQWETVAMSSTAGGKSVMVKVGDRYELQNMERVQASGNPQKMADAIGEIVDISAEIEAEKMKLYRQKEEVIRVIEQLPASQYSLLHLMYVQDYSLKVAAYEEGRSYSWAKKTHKKGVANVQKILNERKEGQ